jgi:GT2 family glycosyltransferase
MDVTIIIVSYNSGNLLKQCIDSVVEKTFGVNYDIIAVDNASNDNSVDIIKNNYPQIKLIVNKSNTGFAKAVNIALKNTNSKYVFLINPDTVLINNSVGILYDFMEKESGAASCGGALFDEEMNPVISYGFFPSLRQLFFEESGFRKISGKYYFNNLSPGCVIDKNTNSAFTVDYVSGADMFIRKEIFEKTGFLDEDFFLYYEETELSYRIRKQNYKNMIVPDSKIIHLEGKSLNGNELKKTELMKRSEILFFRKCYGSISSVLAKLILLAGSVIKLVFKLDKKQLKIFKVLLNS